VRSDQVLGRTWGEKGKTPEVPTSGQRQSIKAISAVNARGAFWYAVYAGRFNATRFKEEFLTSFMRGRRRPVFLVVDGHPAHRAKLLASYVKQLKGRLELHFLPGYVPELNPDEFVWNYVKREGTSKKPLKRNESLRQRVESNLATINRRPALVRAFFRAPSVLYTKDCLVSPKTVQTTSRIARKDRSPPTLREYQIITMNRYFNRDGWRCRQSNLSYQGTLSLILIESD